MADGDHGLHRLLALIKSPAFYELTVGSAWRLAGCATPHSFYMKVYQSKYRNFFRPKAESNSLLAPTCPREHHHSVLVFEW